MGSGPPKSWGDLIVNLLVICIGLLILVVPLACAVGD